MVISHAHTQTVHRMLDAAAAILGQEVQQQDLTGTRAVAWGEHRDLWARP